MHTPISSSLTRNTLSLRHQVPHLHHMVGGFKRLPLRPDPGFCFFHLLGEGLNLRQTAYKAGALPDWATIKTYEDALDQSLLSLLRTIIRHTFCIHGDTVWYEKLRPYSLNSLWSALVLSETEACDHYWLFISTKLVSPAAVVLTHLFLQPHFAYKDSWKVKVSYFKTSAV